MSAASKIEWTDVTWNPIRGCSRVSPGCVNCYAERQAYRFSGPSKADDGLVTLRNGRPGWTGDVRVVAEHLDDLRDRNDAGFDGAEATEWPREIGDADRVVDIERGFQGAEVRVRLLNKKGGDPGEWPADLRVREMPEMPEMPR